MEGRYKQCELKNGNENITKQKFQRKKKPTKVKNQDSPISIKENEFILKNILKEKTPDPDGFIGEFYHTFKGEIIPILHKLRNEKRRNTSEVMLLPKLEAL